MTKPQTNQVDDYTFREVPIASFNEPGSAQSHATETAATTVVIQLDAVGKPLVRFGVRALMQAKGREVRSIAAFVVRSDWNAQSLVALDAETERTLVWEGRVASILKSIGFKLADIQSVLGLSTVSDAHRAVRLGERPAHLLRQVPQHLQRGHLRYLSSLDDGQFAEGIRRIARGHLSVAELRDSLHENSIPTAENKSDLESFANSLGAALATRVHIDWPDDENRRALRIAWYGPEDLLQVLERLAKSGSGQTKAPPTLRWLNLQVRNTDELEAIIGNLGQ